MYASYIDLHLEINNGGILKTKLYDKRNDFTFQIVNFTTYTYSRACAQYIDFLDGALPLKRLLKQGYVVHRAESSLEKLYGRHHNLVDRYEISISQMTMDRFYVDAFFPLSLPILLPDLTVCYLSNTADVLSAARTAYPLRATEFTSC